jgi:predicted ester cyclase
MRMTVEDLIASGDKTVARVKATGTHKGEFIGVPPAGTRVDVQLIDIDQLGQPDAARPAGRAAHGASAASRVGGS